ncbi:MAG: hypothetical protein ACXAE3_12780 [Candidatus Kariarchaeaceae archaeon]|jgi:ribosomal protein S18 acetylase RimI-like enzyme
MYNTRMLSCPVVRPARQADAHAMASLVVQSGSKFIESVFKGDMQGAYKVLLTHYQESVERIYVVTEAEKIVGLMKLHVPNQMIGNSISFLHLIKILGLKRGTRAGILLSHWDEYKQKPDEAYIEYLYVSAEWANFNVMENLLERAFHESYRAKAKYVTHFIPVNNYLALDKFKDQGFVTRRRIRSPLAKLMGAKYTAWYRTTHTFGETPITVKEMVAEKWDVVRTNWQQRRREIGAAMRINFALTLIPVVAGSLAYTRGYPVAAAGWALILLGHLLGARLYLKGNPYGRMGLIIAMVAEGVNLFGRSIRTDSWFDRGWLIPLALVTFWIAVVLLRNPKANFDVAITTA